jgi:uncharacterized protein YecE (DUF72 family)
MDFFVGTSGWYYSWNEERSLDWFVANSGLNAVELNASFYRFPFPNMVKSWAKKGAGLRWSVKVNRLITHRYKFSEKASDSWQKFRSLFTPLDANVDFYLFQLHPRITPELTDAIEKFAEKTGLRKRFALEVRNQEWFKDEWVRWASNLGITWLSVDSPDFPLTVQNTNGLVYERTRTTTATPSSGRLRKKSRRRSQRKPTCSSTTTLLCWRTPEECGSFSVNEVLAG